LWAVIDRPFYVVVACQPQIVGLRSLFLPPLNKNTLAVSAVLAIASPVQEPRCLAGAVTERSKIFRRFLKGDVPYVLGNIFNRTHSHVGLVVKWRIWCRPTSIRARNRPEHPMQNTR
jgi:hypothetical protein